MKKKRTRLPFDWTDVYIEDVPITRADRPEVLAIKRLVCALRRGPSQATRFAEGPPRRVQIFAGIQ